MSVQLRSVYKISHNVVARKIEGETVIIPLVAGIGNLDEELYTLNSMGQMIWDQLDGCKNVETICRNLAARFPSAAAVIEGDVLGFLTELVERKILLPVTADAVTGA